MSLRILFHQLRLLDYMLAKCGYIRAQSDTLLIEKSDVMDQEPTIPTEKVCY